MKYNKYIRLILLICLWSIAFISSNCSPNVAAAAESGANFNGSIILGRPNQNSITASITSKTPSFVYLQWGETSGSYLGKSNPLPCSTTSPAVSVMDGLSPDKLYYYRLFFKTENEPEFRSTQEYTFRTPRAPGSRYNFVVQSDSHLLNKADQEIYKQSMQRMAGLTPDFMFDLGDTFLNDQITDANTQSYSNVVKTVTQQLPYFDIVTRNAPLYLTIGNHEGEYGNFLDGTVNNLAAKSTKARTTFFPNPVPDGFYSGNTETEKVLGQPQNYYAFTWGDALYVSIDPYRYSTNDSAQSKDGWGWTLGKSQYDWFRKTLESSTAKYKFVFAHHAIGNIRGGEQVAKLFEWGGYEKNGKYLFDEKRPGWGKPIQQIMADTNVTIFFQGHDHLFAREVVDGVIYQTLPKPAEKVADQQSNYDSYPNGDVLMNSGFLNITVTPQHVQVDYHRNFFVSSEPQAGNTGVVYSYTVDSSHHVEVLKFNKDDLSTYGSNANDTKKPKDGKGEKKPKGTDGGHISDVGHSSDAAPTPVKSMAPIPDDGFCFTIQADSHLDEKTDINLYKQTLQNVVAENPAFHIELGDTFMSEKFVKTQLEVEQRGIEAKSYFAVLGSIPLYLVNGNHDGESGWGGGKGQNDLMTWARAARLKYFPALTTPESYSGNTVTANYYSFTKGNAQFIFLDPFTYTTEKAKGSDDGWSYTLGKNQYDWLKKTLENSKAKYKFVFIHNLVGGYGKDARGGAEAAKFFEWGGYSSTGKYEFDKMRPGWGKPIHQLMVENHVSVVFHGHDHFYAKQELDGIVYQLVPQPGTPGNSVNDAAEYSYQNGVFLPSAGHLRVVVSNAQVIVEYVRTSLQKDINGSIADSYVNVATISVD